MSHRRTGASRAGFALAFAVAVLVAFSLAVALLIDGAVASFRTASADLELARVERVAESALVAAMAQRFDSSALHVPAGTVLLAADIGGPDSVRTTIRVLAAPAIRVSVSVRSHAAGIRVLAGCLAYARMLRDPAQPAALRAAVIGPAWWVPTP